MLKPIKYHLPITHHADNAWEGVIKRALVYKEKVFLGHREYESMRVREYEIKENARARACAGV